MGKLLNEEESDRYYNDGVLEKSCRFRATYETVWSQWIRLCARFGNPRRRNCRYKHLRFHWNSKGREHQYDTRIREQKGEWAAQTTLRNGLSVAKIQGRVGERDSRSRQVLRQIQLQTTHYRPRKGRNTVVRRTPPSYHATALCLHQNSRRVRPPLRLLRHSADYGQASLAKDGRHLAGSSRIGSRRREGISGYRAGTDLLRRGFRRQAPHYWTHFAYGWHTRSGVDKVALRLSEPVSVGLARRDTRETAGLQVSWRSPSAHFRQYVIAYAPPRNEAGNNGFHSHLAWESARTAHTHHAFGGFPRRNRRGFQRVDGLCKVGTVRAYGRIRLLARRRNIQRAALWGRCTARSEAAKTR